MPEDDATNLAAFGPDTHRVLVRHGDGAPAELVARPHQPSVVGEFDAAGQAG